jgi:two-component system sensor histidine kinase HydH
MIRTYPGRVLVITTASSLLMLGLCGTVAISLYQSQARSADILSEDIDSRGAAIDLEATLHNLAALLERRARDVTPLHDQVQVDLVEIDRYADKAEERELAALVAAAFADYLDHRRAGASDERLAHEVRHAVLPLATNLRTYNGQRLQESEEAHRSILRHTAWGLAAVGGIGSVAGGVLGFGLARSLRRSIHQFLVRVQGASDLLGQELPAVEVDPTGEPLDDGGADLLRRVEMAVLRLQQQEREVRRAERMAALGQLAAGVAHEIRNPLTSVQLLVQTAIRDPAAGGLDAHDLDLIDAELGRIEESLRTFLDYARPPRPERVACDPAAVVRDALNLTRSKAEQSHVEVRFTPPAEPVALCADPRQLRQVVVNLVLNALDAMPAGGTLDVAAAAVPGGVELTVTDTGPGISPDILPRLFEPFATGKETGLGLGLVVSKRIVEDHGGSIAGANRPAGGARFAVRLPLARPAEQPIKAGVR